VSGARRAAIAALILAAVLCVGCKREQVRSAAPAPGTHSIHDPFPPPTVREGPAPRDERDQGPPVPPDVSRVPDAVPRAEPPSAYGNKSPYTVLGRTYRVLPSSRGYRERGLASWYGEKFHGRLTSSREVYDMYAMTAAHKTLPLPTFARVTNIENGRSVVVRINDRGPFHERRIIDLSYAAAIKLGIHVRGTGEVVVEAIDSGAAELAQASAVPGDVTHRPLFLQVGAFGVRENARRLAARLENAAIGPVLFDHVALSGRPLYRVRVGPFADVAALDAMAARLRRLGIRGVGTSAD
jgi:rare lipoprotein A